MLLTDQSFLWAPYSKARRESSPAGPASAVLLETGDGLLLEDGSFLLLENN